MVDLEFISKLSIETDSKILLVVMDGLGSIPNSSTDKTELETAKRTNLDNLVKKSICGLSDPVSPGITPGSGPGHLGILGYNPVKYVIGRGVLGAVGIGFDVTENDVAARANFCTVDENEIVTDRRAGRISTEVCTSLCNKLDGMKIDDVEVFVKPEKEHRAAVIFRGTNLGGSLTDSDPQKVGLKPKLVENIDESSKKSATIINKFIKRAKDVLKDSHPANMVLLRGFAKYPNLPSMRDVYKLKPLAIATYPMYKGLAKLAGMDVANTGDTLEGEINAIKTNFENYNFFFFHFKKTDSTGEDGNFEKKVEAIEEFDSALNSILKFNFDVIVITADHSTPSALKSHSWHPNPILLYSKYCITDEVTEFTERECAKGGLGRINALDIMPLTLAHALKLNKYGA